MSPSSVRRFALFAAAISLLLLAPTVGSAQAPAKATSPLEITRTIENSDGVTVVKLSNGLTLIVKPTRVSPVVTVEAYVHTGSLYEGRWLGMGLSHLVEHLTAEGAAHDSGAATAQEAKKTSDRVEQIGGQSNAYTTLDRTAYFIAAASSRTKDCIDLVAEWMTRPQITQADFDRESGVTQRELEMYADSPDSRLWDAHVQAVFGTHPASLPTVGLRDAKLRLTLQDVIDYRRKMYVPQNMVFVVVGDVDPAAVIDQVRRVFADFGTAPQPDLALPEVRTIVSPVRSVVTHKSAKQAAEVVSFQSIALLDKDLYALDLLANILGAGDSSILSQSLKEEKKLVTSVSADSWTPEWGRGLFNVSFKCDPANVAAAEKEVFARLKQVVDDGPTEAQLARAKRQKLADLVATRQSVQSQAEMLATDYLATGDVTFSAEYTRRIQIVTTQEVKDAARKYLTGYPVITTLLPTAAAPAVVAPASAGSKAKPTLMTLPNGLRVVYNPVPGAGLVSMYFVTRGGIMVEDEKTSGLGNLMADMMARGADKLSAKDIAEFFDEAGGSIAGGCGNNTFFVQASVLDDRFDKALDIFGAVITKPTFDKDELDLARKEILAGMAEIESDWYSATMQLFRGNFFAGTPYAHLPIGAKAVVEAATPEQLAAHHKKYLKAGDSVLAVCGSFDVESAKKRVEQLFGGIPAGKNEVPACRTRPNTAPMETITAPTKLANSGVIVGVPGMKLGQLDDQFAMNVLQTIMSGWQLPSGWLHEELRGKQLVYVVHAINWQGLIPGSYYTYALCEPAKTKEVVDIILKNYRKAAAYTPTQAEVDQAVNVILTAELLDAQSLRDVAAASALDELLGLGFDFHSRIEGYYRAVKPADVLRVAQKYLGADGYMAVYTVPETPAASPSPSGGGPG